MEEVEVTRRLTLRPPLREIRIVAGVDQAAGETFAWHAMAPAEMKPFDRDAQTRTAARFRTCPSEEFLDELASYRPRSDPETVTLHKFRGWALDRKSTRMNSSHSQSTYAV